MKCWVLCKCKYNPYDSDWWEWCAAPFRGNTWMATPKLSRSNECPVIFTQTELSRDLSNLLNDIEEDAGHQWFWTCVGYRVLDLVVKSQKIC